VSDVDVTVSFDLLASVCRKNGWAVLVRIDGRNEIPPPDAPTYRSRVTSLDIVDPAATGPTRKRRIAGGDLLARVPVCGAYGLQHAAAEALDRLGAAGLLDEIG
jgi:hypothetical protein